MRHNRRMAEDLPQRRAAGFVLVRAATRGLEYLLLTNSKRGEPGLPKGHAEEGEDDVQTAFRETEEETGLTDLAPYAAFRREIGYPAHRKGVVYQKTVVYLLAKLRSGEVRLSPEHSEARWLPLEAALQVLPYAAIRSVVRDAALYLKDPALFRLEHADEAHADAHLRAQPQADERLLAHLRGGARLARGFATALAKAGHDVDPEAAAAGTLLHDVGRALGEHEDHQAAGLKHLRRTPLAAYGFACISHFTKGATEKELLEARVPRERVADFEQLIDGSTLTWEERCAALADACMMGPTPTTPERRFADLRKRYDAPLLIDLQERLTDGIRRQIAAAIGTDPLAAAQLA
jgi:bis(5'-nucleosidyl)-tetraphosphatase